MGVREQLEKKIENKRLEIQEYETKIREANAFLQGLQEAIRMLPRDTGSNVSTAQNLRPGSDMAKVRDFLANLGRPAYITEILEGIGKSAAKLKDSSVGNSLASYARKGEIFKRTAPNTFALINSTSVVSVDKSAKQEPPDSFGSEEQEPGGSGENG
jgi:hypothetical protein